MKRILKSVVFIWILVIALMSGAPETTVAMTKKELDKEIKTYEKVAELNYKAWKKEEKKYKQQAKGVYLISSGTLISQNPMIIKDDHGETYYYVKSGTGNIAVFGSQVLLSYIKPTKQYKKLGLYNCIVVKGVTVDANPDLAKKEYQEYKDILKKLYAAKNATIKIKPPKKLRVNNTEMIDYQPANTDKYYSEVKIVSHSDNIEATIDTYTVDVKGLKEGNAYIKLKCDSSGKTKTIKFKVYPEFDEVKLQDIKIEKDEVKYQIDDRRGIHIVSNKPEIYLDYKLIFKKGDDPKNYKEEISVTSSDENVIEVINQKVIRIKNTGNATITISSGGISKEIRYCITSKSMDTFKELAGTYVVSNVMDSGVGSAMISIYSSMQEGKQGYIVGEIALEINGRNYYGQLEAESMYTLLINTADNSGLTLDITWLDSVELYERNKLFAKLIKQI